MRIRTQFIITMLLFGIILVIIAASAIITHQKLEKTSQQENLAADIAQGASELSYLSNDYLIYRESQQLKRWQSRLASFFNQAANLNVGNPDQQYLVRNIQANAQRSKEVFDSVVSATGSPTQNRNTALDPVFLQVSWSRMAVQSQGLVSDASRLSRLLHEQMDQLTNKWTMLMYAMLGLFGVFLLASYMLTYRGILKSIVTLQAHTAVVGSGNLDFRTEQKRNDEIGDLSRAFNQMTINLKTVTSSKAELEREVIQRKQAEEDLRRQREWLRVTLTSMGDAVIASDTGGRITFLNPVAMALTGWQLEEAMGQPIQGVFRIINQKTHKSAEDLVVRVLNEKRVVGLANDTVLLTKDGREVPIEDSAAPILDAAGNVTGVVLVFHDVTEKRRAQAALYQAHEQAVWLARFPDENPNPVLRASADGTVLYCNAASVEIQGWVCQVGQPLQNELLPLVGRAMTEGREVQQDVQLDGRVYIVWVVPFQGEGYANVYGRDITDRKWAEEALHESEERLKRSQEIARLGSWELDLVHNQLTWSDEVYRIFGLQPQEFGATYEAFLERVHPDDRAAVDAAYSDSLRENRDAYEIEHRAVRNDTGDIRVVHEKCEHFRDTSGKIIRSVGMVQDITERKRTEEALRKSKERFELLSETASRLLATDKPQEIVSELCQKVMAHLDCHAFFNYVVDEKKERFHLCAYSGIPEETAKEIEWLEFGGAVSGCAARDACRIVAEDIPKTQYPRTDLVKSFGIKAYACHPLLSAGRVIGTLSFGTQSKLAFTEDELALMKTVTDQVAVAMERIRLLEVARQRADELDAVFNAMAESVIIYDSDGNPVKANPAARSAFGVNPANVDRKTVFGQLFPKLAIRYLNGKLVDADGLPSRRALRGEKVSGEHFIFTNAEGKDIIILASASPLFVGETILGAVAVWNDVTEREQLLEQIGRSRDELEIRVQRRTAELARANELLERVFSSVDVSLAYMDKDFKFIRVNRAYAEGNERTPEFYIGKNHFVLFPNEENEQIFRKVVETGEAYSVYAKPFEYTEHPERGVTYWDWSLQPVKDPDGTVGGIVLSLVNVTDRIRAQEAVEAASLYTRSLIEASLDPLVTINADGKIMDVNRATEHVTGVVREQLIGSDFSGYFTESEKAREGYQQVFSTGSVRDYALAIRHASGRATEVLYNATLYRNERGEIQGVFAAARDVTELKSAEQERLRLVAAIEQAVEGIVIAHPDGRAYFANQAFERINGLSRKEVFGRNYYDILPPEGEEGGLFQRRVEEVFSYTGMWRSRVSRRKKNGELYDVDVTISPVREASGAVMSYVIIEHDVTQELRLQEHVRQWQKMEAIGTLAGGIAHDFNNILMPITINTELAFYDIPEGSPVRQYLQLVLDAASRGKELVKQITTFSRQKEQERRPVKISPVVKEGLKFLRSSLPKNIEIREIIEIESDVALADPTQIHQILINLCNNGAYAMREKGGVLSISLTALEVDPKMSAEKPDLRPGPYLRLSVNDTGCGMERHVLEKVFDPFFTTKKKGEGTGMGLPVVAGIVRAHHGAITVSSEPGKGSMFSVFLPRIEGDPESDLDFKDLIPEGTERILFVDDEEAQAQTGALMLQRLGYRVVTRTDSEEALKLFKQDPHAIDLVVTDQSMPRMTGAKLAAELMRIRPDIPVILCTGFSETIDADEAKALGIREFVMKPFTVREMAETIRKALKK